MDTIRLLPMQVFLALTGMQERLEEARKREDGQALVEYALLLALIAVVSIGILTLLGHSVSKIFSKINHKL